MNRRHFLQHSSLGWLAFCDLASAAPIGSLFQPKAKSIILCYLSGGLSQVDSFDPNPLLTTHSARAAA